MRSIALTLLLGIGWLIRSTEIYAETSAFRFEQFSLNAHLSSKTINTIHCDKHGYVWAGTTEGLIRFDGHEVKTFKSSPLTPGKLINNEILSLASDQANQLWIGTAEGLMYIDSYHFTIKTPDIAPLKSQRINTIICDHQGYIWVGTQFNGLVRIDPKTLDYTHYNNQPGSSLQIRTNTVIRLFEDSKKRIWVTSWKEGISLISSDRSNVRYLPKVGNTDNTVKVYEDRDGLIWLGTWDDGVFYVKEPENEQFSYSKFIISNESTASIHNIVHDIIQDAYHKYIWLISYEGMVAAKKNPDGSLTIISSSHFFNTGNEKTLKCITTDNYDNLWIGAIADGLYMMNFNALTIKNISLSSSNALRLPPHVAKICEIDSGQLLIAIDRAGPFWLNPKNGQLSKTNNNLFNTMNTVGAMIKLKKKNEVWISHLGQDKVFVFSINNKTVQLNDEFVLSVLPKANENTINVMYEDQQSNVWFGTRHGLYFKATGKPSGKVDIACKDILSIVEDRDNLWFGTLNDGLIRMPKKQTSKKIFVEKIPLSYKSLDCKSISSLYSNHKGDIYAATKEGCLFKTTQSGKEVVEISSRYGITDNAIIDIVEDSGKHLWLVTSSNIVKYNTKTHTCNYFDYQDGIENTTFFGGSALLLSNQLLAVGGNKGVTIVNPAFNAHANQYKYSKVTITDILINNSSVIGNSEAAVTTDNPNRITLSHNQNSLQFSFSVINHLVATKIKYAFKLEGFDKDWHYGVINQHQITYYGLNPGNYTFMVKSSLPDGSWSDTVTSFEVRIRPPFYLTWWAISILLVLILGAIAVMVYTYIHKNKIKKELMISQLENAKKEELTQTKLRYFTNISHDLLTPLSIISLQIEKLQSIKTIDLANFSMIRENVFRLKRLVSQILIFRKAESDNLKLQVSKNEIISFIRKICEVEFQSQFRDKNLTFQFSTNIGSYSAFYDPDKLDKIIYNLLSNACKYTPEAGSVLVSIEKTNREMTDYLLIKIADNGIGIAKEDMPYIFDRFYTGRHNKPDESHGIGLSLVHELVTLHKGTIRINSEINKGTTVEITLPVSLSCYTDDEIASISNPGLPIEIQPESDAGIIRTHFSKKDFCLLVVEDNRELRDLIVAHFSKAYTVYKASNGVQAIQKLKDYQIDLVITDIMMPEMDGITLCKTIRSTPEINHINILILTAKNSPLDEIESYNSGVDGYISKPFEMEVLEARVTNFFEKRLQLFDNYRKNTNINTEMLQYNPIDQAYMNHAIEVLKANIEDENLDLEKYSQLMATSKSTLNRKLKSLTGLSPCDFIKDFRLKYARELLDSKVSNISEIAYLTGFRNPKYFSRCFRLEYGMNPSKYRDELLKNMSN